MVYDNNPANTSGSELKPVLLVVSLVTAIGFGGMYACYSNSQGARLNDQSPPAAARPQTKVRPQTAVDTVSRAKNRTRV